MQHQQSEVNRKAWSFRAYEFWNNHIGTPAEAAKMMINDPKQKLRRHLQYFGDVQGMKIANLLGSNGRKAVPLALLGADVTVIDISEENQKYALELASEAGVGIQFIVADLMEYDMTPLHAQFDLVYLEGGILHYFNDLHRVAEIIYSLLREGGKVVLSDFHPVRKMVKLTEGNLVLDGDYFDSRIHRGEVAYQNYFSAEEQVSFPECLLRYWTLGEIVTAIAQTGFRIEELVESPRYDEYIHIPGEFTLIALKGE
jgi:SAM-dependent methyltransferase